MLDRIGEDGKFIHRRFCVITRVEGDYIYGKSVDFIDYKLFAFDFCLFPEDLKYNDIIYDKECLLKNLINRFPEKLVSRVKFESSKMRLDVWKAISGN